MIKRFATLAATIGVFSVIGLANAESVVDLDFRAKLKGDNVVPAPVSTETAGKFKASFEDGEFEFRLKVRDGFRVRSAHLHCAPEGQEGPLVARIAGFDKVGWDVDGTWIKNTFLLDRNIKANTDTTGDCPEVIETVEDLVAAMENGNIYVDVHTKANPDGEIRGQVELD
jgi:hypothetical protein